MSRRYLVTGGGSGIGRAVALHLARRGDTVVIVGRRRSVLDQVVAEAEKTVSGTIVALPADLTDPSGRAEMVSKAVSIVGQLDGLVHAAGVAHHEAVGAISEAALREQLEIHLVAPLRLFESALPYLRRGAGVVFVSSTLALRPVPTSAVYSAAKAGMLSLVQTLAGVGAPLGIRVNAVSPGVVDTDMVRGHRPDDGTDTSAAIEQRLEALRLLHPLGRLGTVDDVAVPIVHLLDAPWTTGANLVVDGGLLVGGSTV